MLSIFDLVIRGGTLIFAGETIRADIGIQQGKIVVIGNNLSGKNKIDAGGLYVLPGAVDPHVHLEMSTGITTSSDDFKSGTVAAACGGTTTVIDFIEPESGQPLMDAFVQRRKAAEGKAVVDFGLHMTLVDGEKKTIDQLPSLFIEGITSFKTYTTYSGFKIDDTQMIILLEKVSRMGGLLICHAENDAVVQWCTNKYLSHELKPPSSHPLSRPSSAESDAIERILSLAEMTQASVYLVHISTSRGADALNRARQRGQKAFGETCPQYLLLNDSEYNRPGFEGSKFVCSPPLRKKEDNQALWKALSSGIIQTIATDHCPFFFKGQKDLGIDNFSIIPGGIPGVELRLSLIYTLGVSAGYFNLNRWVETCAAAPAKIFGIYPRKGSLLPGADADIVLFDPFKSVTVSQSLLHEDVDYTPYEGMQLQGYPVMTIKSGIPIVKDNQFLDLTASGKYIHRGLPKI